MTLSFLESNIALAILSLISIKASIIILKSYFCQGKQDGYRNILEKKSRNFGLGFLYRWIIFPITASFLIPVLLSAFIFSLRLTSEEGTFPLTLDYLALLLVSIFVGLITFIEFVSSDRNTKGEVKVKSWLSLSFW